MVIPLFAHSKIVETIGGIPILDIHNTLFVREEEEQSMKTILLLYRGNQQLKSLYLRRLRAL